ncbi:hypothetical protein MFU01_47990 [Myxococcus fulvus]|uniref:Uncharacterized protein n=1 Tax=Myxococcus fulvus TaxID=33 RepID=A0A511T8C8_MYXFU|nr:hypothetical protein MFU01_47990 [Myxococcus fulvus]
MLGHQPTEAVRHAADERGEPTLRLFAPHVHSLSGRRSRPHRSGANLGTPALWDNLPEAFLSGVHKRQPLNVTPVPARYPMSCTG